VPGFFYFSSSSFPQKDQCNTPNWLFSSSSVEKNSIKYDHMNQKIILVFALLFASLITWQCTPKTTEAAKSSETTTQVKPSKPMVSKHPCAKFSDSKKGEAALDAHVIYRDYLRAKDFKNAIPFWRQSFAVAPAADGKRRTHFEDGILIYEHLMEQNSGDQKKVYLDSILYMFDRMDQCYGDAKGYKDGRIAFNLYYKYRSMASNQEIFDRFTTAIDAFGVDAPAFVVNPFTALLVEMYNNKEIAQDEAVGYAKTVLKITDKNKDNEEEGWPIVLNYAPARLEVFETVKGFFDCEYYQSKYYPDFAEAPTDCDVIETVLSRLKWGGCDENSDEIQALRTAYEANCRVITTAGTPGPLRCGRDRLEAGEYKEAIDCYQEYIDNQLDPDKRAKYLLRIAKIYYAHLKDFPKSRQYARLALKERPNWGEPYLVIGKLYASSGPLCGPGRGWDSQIVTWPAIDKFIQAKSVDPSFTAEANKWIATYSKYMPSNEDIFQRQLQKDQSFKVGCWIQETTTIRPARK
jgi:tetratricopeptide (TPR) repeat protein